jgi:hypothetical protein
MRKIKAGEGRKPGPDEAGHLGRLGLAPDDEEDS